MTQGVGVRAEFTGRAGQFFRLALVGNLLQLPTFGFYRFWLISDIRRHLWSHTSIGGENFEYTGRGRELLIGFLIALAILTPLYIAYFLLGVQAELFQAFASLPLAVIFYVLAYYGNYRARRYRATRTTFRGVRLWMTGSGWRFAGKAIVWDMLTVITLGLALPWRIATLERYKMRNTYFGDLPARFTGTGGGLFKRGWWLWAFSIVPFAILGPIMAGSSETADAMYTGIMVSMMVMGWLLILAAIYPLFRAIEMRWWLEGIHFGELTLISKLRMTSVLGCYLKTVLAGSVFSFLTIGIFAALWLKASTGGFDVSIEDFDPTLISEDLILPMVVFYGLMLTGFGVIMLHFWTRGLWRVTVNSLTLANLAALDSVAARGAAAERIAEGFADALDFGAAGV